MEDKVRGRRSLGREKVDSMCRVSEATSDKGRSENVFSYSAGSSLCECQSLTPSCRHHQSGPISSQRLIALQRRRRAKVFRELPAWFWHDGQTQGARRSSLERSRDLGAEDVSEPDKPTKTQPTATDSTEHTPNNEPKIIPCERQKESCKTVRET